jgi:hypothetical protein
MRPRDVPRALITLAEPLINLSPCITTRGVEVKNTRHFFCRPSGASQTTLSIATPAPQAIVAVIADLKACHNSHDYRKDAMALVSWSYKYSGRQQFCRHHYEVHADWPATITFLFAS